MNTVYLNGEFLPIEEAKISVLDRGFLFGDAVYEVIPAYDGRLFYASAHLIRLQNSLNAIQLDFAINETEWLELLNKLLVLNGSGDQTIYIQISRGYSQKRTHYFPETVTPTVFISTSPMPETFSFAHIAKGAKTITQIDERWKHCDIKSTNLLANVLAREAAQKAGVDETILILDGHPVEGSSSNLFVVYNGVILTPPKSGHILGGISREIVLEIAKELALPYEERAITLDEFSKAEEIWLTSSTRTVAPVIEVDGKPVNTGKPGPIWEKVFNVFREKIKLHNI